MEVYNRFGDWDLVREESLAHNLLQKRTLSSSKTIFREIKFRLSRLTDQEKTLLLSGGYEDQTRILYLGVCKYYGFIRDFILEIIRNKVLTFDTILSRVDYDRFVDYKMESHPELDALTESSSIKLRTVIWRMLAEAGFLESTKTGIIIPFMLSEELAKVIIDDNPEWLKVFLLPDRDIERLVMKYDDKQEE
jgi:hypothetical protein